jgi:hypothetical protein
LGLAIGLKGVEKMRVCIGENPDIFGRDADLWRKVESLGGYLPLAGIIERFWLDNKNREDGNMVMRATSIAPEGFLTV